MKSFEGFGLSQILLNNIKKMGLISPTQIQELSMPHILKGMDIVGESATGSGKTLAFGCGIIEHAAPKAGLQSLVLTPTRELAEQVKGELVKLSYQKSLKIAAIYGGVPIGPQIRSLSEAEVVVATPGRMLDHMHRKTIVTSKIKILVLDEADRMLDMGFIDDVEKIIHTCPEKRQTMLFSATISYKIRELAKKYMHNPVHVSGIKMVDPKKLKQVYYDVHRNLKLSLLIHLLQHEKSGLVMVFCNTRKNTDFVADTLKVNGVNAIATHGGLPQTRRTKTMDLFNKAGAEVLVCTDVAARGLHIDNVSHIYNYELPQDPKDYIHRIGRTARAGEEGKVINLVCLNDHRNFAAILKQYREFSIKKIERPDFNTIKNMGRLSSPRPSGRLGRPRSGGRRMSMRLRSRNMRRRRSY